MTYIELCKMVACMMHTDYFAVPMGYFLKTRRQRFLTSPETLRIFNLVIIHRLLFLSTLSGSLFVCP